MSVVTEWFESRKDRVGTHSPECYKYHPDCAYLVGRATAAQEIEAAIPEISPPPLFDNYVTGHRDGIWFGMNRAARIALGERHARES